MDGKKKNNLIRKARNEKITNIYVNYRAKPGRWKLYWPMQKMN